MLNAVGGLFSKEHSDACTNADGVTAPKSKDRRIFYVVDSASRLLEETLHVFVVDELISRTAFWTIDGQRFCRL